MNTQLLILTIGAVLILLCEFTLWRLFRRRVEGYLFPREIDISPLRFFTLMRLRICVLLHTVFLLAVLASTLWFAW